jgi:hypothetical protein
VPRALRICIKRQKLATAPKYAHSFIVSLSGAQKIHLDRSTLTGASCRIICRPNVTIAWIRLKLKKIIAAVDYTNRYPD